MKFRSQSFVMMARVALLPALVSLNACGGGETNASLPAAKPNIAFQTSYRLFSGETTPTTVLIRPVPPRLTLATKGVQKVEFLLFGHDMQKLSDPNSAPQLPPELRYFFDLPADFKPGAYPCGTGEYLSEVRVTDIAGQVLSQTFELCPGVPVDFAPVYSSP